MCNAGWLKRVTTAQFTKKRNKQTMASVNSSDCFCLFVFCCCLTSLLRRFPDILLFAFSSHCGLRTLSYWGLTLRMDVARVMRKGFWAVYWDISGRELWTHWINTHWHKCIDKCSWRLGYTCRCRNNNTEQCATVQYDRNWTGGYANNTMTKPPSEYIWQLLQHKLCSRTKKCVWVLEIWMSTILK